MTSALVLGGASWNRIIRVPALPGPGPATVLADGYHDAIGSSGAGKALNLARLGWDTTLWALVGDDDHAGLLRAGLDDAGVRLIAELDPGGTMHHVNLMAPDGERLSIFANPGTLDLEVDHAAVTDLAVRADLVAVTIFEHCRGFLAPLSEAGVDVWIDVHDYDGANPYHDDFIAAARHLQLSTVALPTWRSFAEDRLAAGTTSISCTHGAAGASVLTADGWTEIPPSTTDDPLDTNGAGDAYFAGFATGWALGDTAAACGRRGSEMAAAAIASLALMPEVAPPGIALP